MEWPPNREHRGRFLCPYAHLLFGNCTFKDMGENEGILFRFGGNLAQYFLTRLYDGYDNFRSTFASFSGLLAVELESPSLSVVIVLRICDSFIKHTLYNPNLYPIDRVTT